MAVYNRIFDNKKWDEVSKYNKNLMEDYLLELKAQKKSKGTISQYKNDIRIIFIYIYDELDNKDIYRLKKKNFRNFMLWLQEKGMSSSRINRIFAALRGMLEFASNEEEYEDEIEINYASKVRGLKKETAREIVFLEDEEVLAIYNNLIRNKKYNQALLCALMYESASRRAEVYQVKREDIIDKTGITKNEVQGKRGKKFRLLYNKLTIEAFDLLEKNRTDDFDTLWVNGNDEVTCKSLYNWVISWRKILKKEKNIEKNFNPHSFRHSALENLENGTHYIARSLNKKFTIQELRLLANHSDIGTTQGYLKDKSEDELLNAFNLQK